MTDAQSAWGLRASSPSRRRNATGAGVGAWLRRGRALPVELRGSGEAHLPPRLRGASQQPAVGSGGAVTSPPGQQRIMLLCKKTPDAYNPKV